MEFQKRATPTENAHSPTTERHFDGMTKADELAERKCGGGCGAET